MNVIILTDGCNTQGCALALGGFDGVHVGHRRLIARAKLQGVPVGVMTIVGAKGDVLFTLEERLQVFRTVGADFVVAFDFADIRDQSAEDFLRMLEEKFSPAQYVCGYDFRFGKDALGDADTILRVSDVPVSKENLVSIDGEKVSTRNLKKLLAAGDVDSLRLLLGAPFFVTGKVESGRKVGRTMGFPTANIVYPQGKTKPKAGVYQTRVRIDGQLYKGITNFGPSPTFGEQTVCLETHLDGFCGDLYGKTLTVQFIRFLRDIEQFPSADALKEQLEKDLRKVREND